ncbi:VOC family protein [Streptomyces chartreusis]|uniref:VOC family protein n=1 Tax=Streptomyces chartreusis TaxID=1969 RepID=UPI0036949FAC
MTFTDLYHVGVVVADLDAAAAEFEQLLGVHWARPRQQTLRIRTQEGTITPQFRYTYSQGITGQPLIELIEAAEGTPWWPGAGVTSALHHIGFWADPLASTAARLSAAGAPVEAALLDHSGSPKVFTYHQLVHGPRVELVDPAQQEAMYAWINEEGG